MKNFIARLLLVMVCLAPLAARAQQAKVVAACGTVPLPLAVGSTQYMTIDVNGNSCMGNGTIGGLAVTDGLGTDTTGAFTGTGAGTLNASIDGFASAKIQIKGTYAAFTVTTNASSDGGTTFVPLQCALTDGSQVGASFSLAANQSAEIACGHQSGDDTLQLSTAAGPATGTANIDISPSAFPSMDGATIGTFVKGNSNVLQGNGSGTTGAVVGTLMATATTTVYICGFSVSATGTGAVGPITIAGLIGSSQIWSLTAVAAGGAITQAFNPCIPASAVNTNITTTTTADATASAVNVNSWGYKQ